MSFNAIRENEILAKISGFTVLSSKRPIMSVGQIYPCETGSVDALLLNKVQM